MVATNEFEDAWLDEGINSYTEVKVLDSILGKNTSILNIAGITLKLKRDGSKAWLVISPPPTSTPWLRRHTNTTALALTAGSLTARPPARCSPWKASSAVNDTMAKVMRAYFMKYRFTHPTKEDFLKTIEEVSGRDLRWYFSQAVYGTQVMDYEVLKIDSFPVHWYEPNKDRNAKGTAKGDTVFQSYVSLHRKQDFVMPLEVEIKFDNGENDSRALGRTEPLDAIQLPEKSEGRIGGDRSRPYRPVGQQQFQQ